MVGRGRGLNGGARASRSGEGGMARPRRGVRVPLLERGAATKGGAGGEERGLTSWVSGLPEGSCAAPGVSSDGVDIFNSRTMLD